MYVRIIRGQNQIGGSIIEVGSASTRIVLDVGSELNETVPVVPEVEGLFQGEARYRAVLVSHYHGDHIGLHPKVVPGIPVYMGERAYAVHRAAVAWRNQTAAAVTGYLRPGESFEVGDIRVLPLLCDHSAFDSYMIRLECEGKSLLYTGDFRSTGRKNYQALLRRLGKVDLLITEGTTLARPPAKSPTEKELQEKAVGVLSAAEGPAFVLMAATNIDRLVTLFKAARRTGRVFLEDVYTASIACAAGYKIPNPARFSGVRAFVTPPYTEDHYQLLQGYGQAKIGIRAIAKTHFLMCVRSSMKGYLEKLSQLVSFKGGVLLYSLWDGYRQKPEMAGFLRFMEEKGVEVVPVHTSGHAEAAAFDKLIKRTQPGWILPVHTENAGWFKRYGAGRVVYDREFSV